jgi:hypothetical protein
VRGELEDLRNAIAGLGDKPAGRLLGKTDHDQPLQRSRELGEARDRDLLLPAELIAYDSVEQLGLLA